MRRTMFLMMLFATAAATATAQTQPRQACDLLSVADVEATLGVSPLRSFDQGSRSRNSNVKPGELCVFEKVANTTVFMISLRYVDAPDADAITNWLKMVDTKTYNKARPVAG